LERPQQASHAAALNFITIMGWLFEARIRGDDLSSHREEYQKGLEFLVGCALD
jgi:hypothetical protein